MDEVGGVGGARRLRCYPATVEPAKRRATFEDLLSLPEEARAEVLAGTIVTSPAPLPRHSRAQGALRRYIGGPFDDDDGFGGPGGWWILLEVDVRLGPHDVVRPDLAGWRRERLPVPWDVRPIDVRPDWVCEILSPTNAATDRVTKRRLYADHGVPFYWLVDPRERTLEALRLEDRRWVEVGSYDDSAVARIEPFEAIELEVGRLFPPVEAEAGGR
ncbi:MAG: Uma2 family endonuclease [Myxococcales bacterium]|nr:Uma2 family endonuclease [Myxococcales bacterium]